MKTGLLPIVGILLLSACAQDQRAGETYARRAAASEQLTAAANSLNDPAARAPIHKTQRNYLGENRVDLTHGDPLPARLFGDNGFVLTGGTNGTAMTEQELANRIAKATGLTVAIEVPNQPEQAIKATPDPAAPDDSARTINSLLGAGRDTASQKDRKIFGSYAGPLPAFLDEATAKFDTDWDVHGQVIYLGRDIIRSYEVVDFPSTTTLTAGLTGSSSSGGQSNGGGGGGGGSSGGGGTIGGGSGGSGGGGASGGGGSTGGQNTNTTTHLNSWKELKAALVAYTGDSGSEAGGHAIFDEPSNGRVTVKCSRYCQGLVARAIQAHNEEAGRSVLITIAILNVQKSGSDDYGFSPTALYDNLPTGYSLNLLGQTTAIQAGQGGTVTGAVVNPPVGKSSAKYNGTAIAVQAISQDSEITGGFQKYAFIGNNRAFSIRNALDYGYVQSQTTTINANLAATGLTVDTLVVGDQLQILPRILRNGYIRLQLAISRTAIQSISTVSLNGTTISIPQITDNSYSPQEFTIRDGATLILTDISDDSSDRTRSGAGPSWNWLLGGSATASNNGDKTIIIVTAREWHAGDQGPDLRTETEK